MSNWQFDWHKLAQLTVNTVCLNTISQNTGCFKSSVAHTQSVNTVRLHYNGTLVNAVYCANYTHIQHFVGQQAEMFDVKQDGPSNITERQKPYWSAAKLPRIVLFLSRAPFLSSSAYASSATKRTSWQTHTRTHARTTVIHKGITVQSCPATNTQSISPLAEQNLKTLRMLSQQENIQIKKGRITN